MCLLLLHCYQLEEKYGSNFLSLVCKPCVSIHWLSLRISLCPLLLVVWMWVCACVRVRVRVCARVCVYMCVCVHLLASIYPTECLLSPLDHCSTVLVWNYNFRHVALHAKVLQLTDTVWFCFFSYLLFLTLWSLPWQSFQSFSQALD